MPEFADSTMDGAGNSICLFENHLIRDKSTGCTYRVLYVSENTDLPGYWIDIDQKGNVPSAYNKQEVMDKLLSNDYEFLTDTSSFRKKTQASQSSIEKRDRAYSLICNIVKQEPDIYIKSERTRLLKNVETATGVSFNNLYGYLGKYWKGGKCIDALLPNLQNCGGHRDTERPQIQRLGRPKREGSNGKILTANDKKNFETALKRFYLNTRTTSLAKAYQSMLDTMYVTYPNGTEHPPVTMAADQKPSFKQFRYWYEQNRDTVKDTKKKEGMRNFNLNSRAVTGKSETYVRGSGMSVQIDATIGDFYLVRKNHRDEVIGRPVIFFIRDVFSRIITGIHVTLENASKAEAFQTIRNCMENKVKYCSGYGIQITEDQWPCHFVPNSITADNGEMGDKGVETLITKLGITIENCPPYRGDLKGIIEKFFDMAQLKLREYVPGYVDKDAGTRGAEDYRKKACLDLETFTAILIRVVLFFNNYHYLDDYMKTPDMRKNGIRPIPLELWNYGIQKLSGTARVIPHDDILKVLLSKGEATIQEHGIFFHGLYYSCDKAEKEEWFARANIVGRERIPILYDTSSVDKIYIHTEDDTLLHCHLIDKSKIYAGSTIEDMDAYAEADKQEKAAYTQTENQASAELTFYVKQAVKRCQSESAAPSEIKRALTKHGITESREAERAELNGFTAAKKMQKEQGLGIKNVPQKPQQSELVTEQKTADSAMNQVIEDLLREKGLI